MALPSTPPISLRQIADEIGLTGPVSLIQCLDASKLADKSLPVSALRFLGYTHFTGPTQHGAPTNLVVTSVNPDGFLIDWAAGADSTGVTNYRLERRNLTDSGSYELVANTGGDSDFGDDDPTLNKFTPGKSYQFRVRAEGSLDASEWTESPGTTY